MDQSVSLGYTDPGGLRNSSFAISSSALNNLSSYVVTFQLNEADDVGLTQDSAAAFDNIRISGASKVRAVPLNFLQGSVSWR